MGGGTGDLGEVLALIERKEKEKRKVGEKKIKSFISKLQKGGPTGLGRGGGGVPWGPGKRGNQQRWGCLLNEKT